MRLKSKKNELLQSVDIIPVDFFAKRKLNTAPDKQPNINQSDVETNGLPIESLQSLNVPAYRYKTQITIHGIWDDTDGYCGGYKNLVKNKNGSFGIRYSAIDTEKKKRLVSLGQAVESRFFSSRDSQGFCFILNCRKHLNLAVAAVNMIAEDKNLFYGQVELLKDSYFTGNYYIVIWLSSIFEKNITGFAKKILKYSKVKADKVTTKNNRKSAEKAAEKADIERMKQAAINTAEKTLLATGYNAYTPNGNSTYKALKASFVQDRETGQFLPLYGAVFAKKCFGKWCFLSRYARNLQAAVEFYNQGPPNRKYSKYFTPERLFV